MDDLDIWRTAGTLIRMYGPDEAALTAALRADALLDQGDTDGYFAWKRITRAIDELQRTKPAEGDPLH
jgi:hypothetical protein